MPEIGLPEWLIILVIVLIIFGPGRLSGVGGALGQAMREFNRTIKGKQTDSSVIQPDSPSLVEKD